ncbi:hypothetical protein B5M09_012338, partial [Aphanomyces astaci]
SNLHTHFAMRATKRKQNRYSNGQRKQLLSEFRASSATNERQFCREKKIPRATWQDWRSREPRIMASKRHSRHATMGGQGHREILPFKEELLAYMCAKRGAEEHLRVFHLMRWVNSNQKAWLVQYLGSKLNEAVAYQSFRSLMLRFAARHRVPSVSKVTQKVLDDVWLGNAVHVWSTYGHYPRSKILNVDETGVFFDITTGKTPLHTQPRRLLLSTVDEPSTMLVRFGSLRFKTGCGPLMLRGLRVWVDEAVAGRYKTLLENARRQKAEWDFVDQSIATPCEAMDWSSTNVSSIRKVRYIATPCEAMYRTFRMEETLVDDINDDEGMCCATPH